MVNWLVVNFVIVCNRVWTTPWHWTITMQSRWSTGQTWPRRAAWSAACTWTAVTSRYVWGFYYPAVKEESFFVCFLYAFLHGLCCRCCTGHPWAIRTVWRWTGSGATSTGAIRAETPSRFPSWMGLTGACWSTAVWGSLELWLWTCAMGEHAELARSHKHTRTQRWITGSGRIWGANVAILSTWML